MSQEQAKVLTDNTTNPNAHVVREIDLSEAWANVEKLRHELVAIQDGGATVMAKLAGICAPIALHYVKGGFIVRRKPGKVNEDGTLEKSEEFEKIEIKAQTPSDDLAKRLAKEVLQHLNIKGDAVTPEISGVKSKVIADINTIKATVNSAAKASILIACEYDGFVVWPFNGNTPLKHPDEAKTPEEKAALEKAFRTGKLRVACVWNKVIPNFKVGKDGLNPNTQTRLIPAPIKVINTSWAANVNGKRRDAFGNLARGVKDTATNSGTEGFSIPSDADPVQVINAFTRYLERVQNDPTGKMVASLSAMEDTLFNMTGLADKIYTAVSDYNSNYADKEAA